MIPENRPVTPAATRIVNYLMDNYGTAFTNTQIANALLLPQDSVRRVINTLRGQARVAPRFPGSKQWQIAPPGNPTY